jgi:hypothetical protein
LKQEDTEEAEKCATACAVSVNCCRSVSPEFGSGWSGDVSEASFAEAGVQLVEFGGLRLVGEWGLRIVALNRAKLVLERNGWRGVGFRGLWGYLLWPYYGTFSKEIQS